MADTGKSDDHQGFIGNHLIEARGWSISPPLHRIHQKVRPVPLRVSFVNHNTI